MTFRTNVIFLFVVSCCLAQSDSTASFSIISYKPLYCAKRTLNVCPYLNYYSRAFDDALRIDSVTHFDDERADDGSTGIQSTFFYRNQLQSSDLVLQAGMYVNGHLRYSSDMNEAAGGGNLTYNQNSQRSLYESINLEYRHRFYTPLFRNTFVQWLLRPNLYFGQGMQTTKQNITYSLELTSPEPVGYTSLSHERVDYNQSYNLPIQLYFGFGSVYDVTSAAIAMNIFDRIIGDGASGNPGMAARAREYANRIDRLRNKRVFDSRESLIEDVAELSDSLQFKNGLRLTSRQVMEIADEWQYGQNQVRMNGLEFAIGPEVNGSIQNYDYNSKEVDPDEAAQRVDSNGYPLSVNGDFYLPTKYHYEFYTASLVLIAHLQYARPLGRRFQYGGSLLYSFDALTQYARTLNELSSGMPQTHTSHFTFDNSLAWFANIRTAITLKEQYTMTTGPAPEGFSYKFATQLSADYYVFPRLKFSGWLVHEYLHSEDTRYNLRPHGSRNFTLAASMTWDPF